MKRLYGAFNGSQIVEASHSRAALERRNPGASIRRVRETERIVGRYATTVKYEVIDSAV